MKIGVLTYHCPPNFGAQLQALSTVGYLRKMGHEPVVLHWYAKDLEVMYSKRIPSVQVACHNQFAYDTLPLSNLCQEESKLVEEINKLDIDAVLVGSDALFRYIPVKSRRRFSIRHFRYYSTYKPLSCELLDENPFFGSFVSKLQKKIPCSVYAVTSQNCQYKLLISSERKQIRDAISNYNMITVRDLWTKRMVEDILGTKSVEVYPDPVFSFNQNCYIEIPSKETILEKYHLSENYVLISFSDWYASDKYIRTITNVIENRGYQPVALTMPEKLFSAGLQHKIELPLSPLDWYALIIYSKGFVGERMHPIIVCLHNGIPFFSFDEYGFKEKKSFFSKQMIYNPNSSKTYQLVEDAGLLTNLFSYKGDNPLPDSVEVVDRLFSFDIEKCLKYAETKKEQYEIGMSQIMRSFENTFSLSR